MPMFPLGTVLLPGGLIPLHVFEPRYRDMVRDCLRADGEPEFGQVLITRGREAGGGDERAMIGTVAQMLHVDALDENRYAFLAAGTRRIVIDEWLPDDPYPIARVADWPDEEPEVELGVALTAMEARVRAALALSAEVAAREAPPEAMTADRAAADFDISHDPVLATYHLSTLAPIGPADQYRLLAAPGPTGRLTLLGEILDDVEAMLRFRLS
jgi:Lon protease-like protein